jgi:malonyl-CoA/methylmalonyl-CoA synthetase
MQNLFASFSGAFPPDRGSPLMITPAGDVFTYADAERESARLAGFLRDTGLEPGDRVTVQAPKTPQTVWLYLACLRGGFIYHPLNDAYRSAELEYFIADARPKIIVCAPAAEAGFKALTGATDCQILTLDEDGGGTLLRQSHACTDEFETVDCGPEAVAVLLYSSGTTGIPKGAMLTHGNLAANTRTLVDAWGFSGADRLLHALPIYHAHGLFVGLGCVLQSGSSMIFLPHFDVQTVMDNLGDATVMMGIPTFYTRLLNEPELQSSHCRSVRLFISGSAPLSAATHSEFQRRTGHAIVERYGMTETSMNTSNPLDGERRAGTVGPPLPGVRVRIVDDQEHGCADNVIGHIQVQGPNVFPGYWGQPDRTTTDFTADGFFRTGDLGSMSPDGYLSISGREKDMIISGGLNVYPREIEAIIDAFPGVVESAVIGVPHTDYGEGVLAVVVLAPDQDSEKIGLQAELREKLANFKQPKRIVFTRELPRNSMGKIQKNQLRDHYSDTLMSRENLDD